MKSQPGISVSFLAFEDISADFSMIGIIECAELRPT